MKKVLYFATMLFNATGCILSLSLFAFAGSFCFQNLFLVLACCILFIISFTITIIDYNHFQKSKNVCKIYRFEKKFNGRHLNNEVVIKDYKDYFSSRRFDFTIA